jgi:hypothetical protein
MCNNHAVILGPMQDGFYEFYRSHFQNHTDEDTEVVLKYLVVGTCSGWGSSST